MNEVVLFESKRELFAVVKNYEIISIRVHQSIYCLTKIDTTVYVFEPKCPHFDYPLKRAKVSPAGKITCTWHNFQFDLGSGEERELRCRQLQTHQTHWNSAGQLVLSTSKN